MAMVCRTRLIWRFPALRAPVALLLAGGGVQGCRALFQYANRLEEPAVSPLASGTSVVPDGRITS
ncbi:hypothetical protein APR08_006549 [Nocardia amikacinitolerans]|nr:hypothetical protein [Nocardia amikacinitolerans]